MLTATIRERDFPSLKGISYLNTAAESIPPSCVGDALQTYWHDKLRGMRGRDGHFAAVEACREISAKMVGLAATEVSFCSCSSEAYNLLASALNLTAEDEVVVADLDFPAGATPWLRMTGPPVLRVWQAAEGELRAEDLEPLLNERTRLVQVSLVSFYNGHRIDWQPFREAVRRLAPKALISVDVTQALGRVVLDCAGADVVISSTHKWTLGVHGGCIIGVPERNAERLTTHAGGWLHLQNAFDTDRFARAVPKIGAASFSVGMPNFAALYALNAALRYVDAVGVEAIGAHADPLVAQLYEGLIARGLTPMCRIDPARPTGIVAFQHPASVELHAAFEKAEVHVMHQAGRIRLAVHGYNTMAAHPGVFSGVAIIDENAANVRGRMTDLKKQGVRGFRIYAGKQSVDSWLASPGMAEMWKVAADEGLAICPLINPEALAAIDRMAERNPQTPVVIDHFARIGMTGTVTRADLDRLLHLSSHARVHVKTSAFYALGKKTPPYLDLGQMIHELRDSYGAERLMWASDCPFQVEGGHNYHDSIALIRDRLDFLTGSDKAWMLRKTAEKVFFS